MAHSTLSFDRFPLPPPPLPPAVRWGRRLRLLLWVLMWLAGSLALLSRHPADPSFSTSGTDAPVLNWLGPLGAWWADAALVLCGFSVWWLVLVGGRACLGALADLLRTEAAELPPLWLSLVRWCSVLVLLLSSCALEWLRLYGWEPRLPGPSGGVIGALLGPLSQHHLGVVGATVAWLVLWALALPLALRFSWVRVADGVGAWIEQPTFWLGRQFELARDVRLGAKAQRQREKAVAEDQRGRSELPPMLIDPPLEHPSQWALTQTPEASTVPPDFGATEPGTSASPTPVTSAAPAAKPSSPPAQVPVLSDVIVPAPATAWDQEKSPAPLPTPPYPSTEPSDTSPSPADDVAPPAEAKPFDDTPHAKPGAPSHETAPQLTAQATATTTAPAPVGANGLVCSAESPSPAALVDAPPTSPQSRKLLAQAPAPWPPLGLELLDPAPAQVESTSAESLEMISRLIEKKLSDFGVKVRVVAAHTGPVITRYEIEPATGVKGAQVVNLAKDLARSLSLVSIRVVETIPGKNLMALELPNARRQTIGLVEILGAATYQNAESRLTLALGKDIVGEPVVADLARMPHALVAGTTGSGKSVGINGMILSLLYKASPAEVRLILIDPKMLEMSVYEGVPHLLCPVVTDMRQAANALHWCVAEMDRRYLLLSKMGVRNLSNYNRRIDEALARGEALPNPLSQPTEPPEALQRLPQIVIVIDELADLMVVAGKKIEELIARLAQKARAAGLHLVLATQRPSVDVITGLIKANIPTRLSFQVSSKIDSRTVLDQMGAETLLGWGDMLYMASGTGVPVRVHGAFVSDDEVHRVVQALKQRGPAGYVEGILENNTPDPGQEGSHAPHNQAESDPLYDQAVAVVLEHRKASISLVQRHLRIGYNRAARLVEQMQKSGLVSAMASNGNREILAPRHDD